MKATLRRIALGILLLVSCSGAGRAQEATAKRSLVIRHDPSRSSPILAHVAKGDPLTLVQTTADNGYYNVKTEQDVVGWALASSVDVSPAPVITPTPPTQPPPSGQCDDTLWGMCTTRTVSSSIRSVFLEQEPSWTRATSKKPDGVRHEADGDTYGWLKVDSEFQNLLNAGNNSAEGGSLVFEIICKYTVKQADAKAAWSNYQKKVNLPPVGSHVRVVGVYVQDTFHAQWMEIHPVTSIAVE